jgi:hypothetical protein
VNGRAIVVLTFVAVCVATGCGSDATRAASSTGQAATTVATRPDARVVLVRAARSAVNENFRLSLYVLRNNRLPSWAKRSTRGPALAALRSSALARTKQGITIHSQSGHYTIQRIRLDPSNARATARVHDQRRVVPYRAGKRLGRAVVVDERAQIELRRLGNTMRFVVWRISPAR